MIKRTITECMKKYLSEYCVGCGLCESLGKCKAKIDEKGYMHPEKGDSKWLKSVCPAGGSQFSSMTASLIWGKTEAVFEGWAIDSELRRKASSGGVITAIASYLLDKRIVDGVIHVCMKLGKPTATETCISYSLQDLFNRCGSRYSISHPLEIIGQLDISKKYLFIGKPCDVTALKNYMRIDKEICERIPYVVSFFCAGLPSTFAQEKLLEELECKPSECVDLRYRGNGWPGFATAIDIKGNKHQIDYNSSWGKILGRDVMKACRFCMDGIGELADVSCGDLWYLTSDKKPDFNEKEGRNIIFTRTTKGLKLIEEARKNGYIHAEAYVEIDDLQYIQFYQYDRRVTMLAKYAAMKLFFKTVPHYPMGFMKSFEKYATKKRYDAIFKGTLKRLIGMKI